MNIIVQCDGGLCNRINNLINGIYLSKLLNRKLYVWWDLNHVCNCSLEKLFSNSFNQNYKEIWDNDNVYYSHFNTDAEKNKLKNKYGELKHRLTWRYDDYVKMYNRIDDNLNPKADEIISELRSIQAPLLIYSSSLILTEIIPESSVRRILATLFPIPELQDKIDIEIRNNNINNSVIGIHIRRTDYHLLNDQHIMDSINKYLQLNKTQQFLICSDSYASEQKFKKLYPDNVIILNNKSYLETINGKTDAEFINLMRTEKSVQTALIDLYLLANTSFKIFSPVSTFAQIIFRLNKTINNMQTPPKEIPNYLLRSYTLDGAIKTESWYFNDLGAFKGLKYNLNEFMAMVEDAKQKKVKNYPSTDILLHDALQEYPIKDKNVVIMGSGNPWYEAIAIANECRHCYVIEYQKRYLDHPNITYLTVDEYDLNPMQFDCAISISSFEHDGLGRYGDPLNPNGDLAIMLKMKQIVKQNGLLYLAVPTGMDKLVWNAHRIYGEIRLPLLLKDWLLLSTYGELKLDVDAGKNAPSQPLFILKN